MRTRAPWPQMAVATVLVMVLPAMIVGALSAVGLVNSLWAALALAVVLSLALSSAGSAYWRRHATSDVLFSDLLLWGWLRRRRTERRLGRADDLLREAGAADSARKQDLLRELGGALDAQDPYLDGHSRRVARYVTMIAQRMNLPDEQAARAKAAAAVHDVGKLRVAAEVLNKAGPLSDAEFALMKAHAAAGGEMVECLGDPALAAAVRGHHERWDGSGYPDGLVGERIPLEARIISVADTFDAITSARAYRPATLHARALKVIDEEAGRQLDPDAARAFISCYSDRRGAALWAGVASIPRQLAGSLSTSPAELTGAVSAALTAPLVVVAAAAGAAAAPLKSGDSPGAEQQAAITSTATAVPSRSTPTPTPTPSPSPSVTPRASAAPAGPATPTPSAGGVAGESAQSSPAAGTPASPTESARPTSSATVVATPGAPDRASRTAPAPPPENPLLPIDLPPPFATASPVPEPGPTPTPSPSPEEPSPAPSTEPEPTPPVESATPTPQPPSHTADDCKNGGWMDLGYPNQGQCIADADRP